MKSKISRIIVVAAIAALAVLFGAVPVLAQVPNFPSGFSTGNLCDSDGCSITVNGGTISGISPGTITPLGWTPIVTGDPGVLRLTQDTSDQRGSAWFNTPQPVTKAWTTTFQYRLSSPTESRGDGFAFVIQNSGLNAIGGFGGGLGYGTRCSTESESTLHCVPDGTDPGISNSLAIEFDLYPNTYDPNNNHIAVQSCGTDANSPNHGECSYGVGSLPNGPDLFGQHTVRIDYTPSTCESDCSSNLFVYLDGNTQAAFSTFVNIASTLSLGDAQSAYVGFTAATKGVHENHDILSWTFTPSQTKPVSAGGDGTSFSFGDYSYTAKLNSGNDVNVKVAAVLKSQTECNALVQPTFPGAQCFVYNNADGLGAHSAVMFEVTCPDTTTGECGSDVTFDAELGSKYVFDKAFNPGYRQNADQNPLPGWLKGHPTDLLHPCNPNPNNTPALFQSNQITSFVVEGDPTATTKGKSGGTGSCWVATYNTPNVVPSVSVTTPANTNYPVGANIASAFTCTAVNAAVANNDPNFPTGPYLTVPTSPTPGCTATIDGSPTPITSGTPILTTPGPHTFVATVLDSGSDTKSTQTINYNVVGPTDVAILKVGPLLAPIKSKVTYVIGVGDIGSQPAVDVNVTDILPANTTFVSVSANKVSCSIVNKKLVCTTTSVPCTGTSTVSCSLGTIQPLSLSNLNGATIKLTVQLGNALTAGKVVQNTAKVSSTNTDTNTRNNSSTASTLLIAH